MLLCNVLKETRCANIAAQNYLLYTVILQPINILCQSSSYVIQQCHGVIVVITAVSSVIKGRHTETAIMDCHS